MKKLLALLLIISICAFGMISCRDKTPDQGNEDTNETEDNKNPDKDIVEEEKEDNNGPLNEDNIDPNGWTKMD